MLQRRLIILRDLEDQPQAQVDLVGALEIRRDVQQLLEYFNSPEINKKKIKIYIGVKDGSTKIGASGKKSLLHVCMCVHGKLGQEIIFSCHKMKKAHLSPVE